MTLDEIRQARQQAQDEIAATLDRLQHKTGMRPVAVHVEGGSVLLSDASFMTRVEVDLLLA